MLDGIRANEIIVGAYADRGGVCPMLAAHRAGGRTNMISFAHAWDRFALRRSRVNHPRRATERELRVLRTHLEASLLAEEVPQSELAAAVVSHRKLKARRERPGDPDRARELRARPGWAWLRITRSYNEYELMLEELEQQHAASRERELVG